MESGGATLYPPDYVLLHPSYLALGIKVVVVSGGGGFIINVAVKRVGAITRE